MQKHSPFNIIKPYLSASFAITAVVLLVAAVYLISGTAQHWIASLWGILITTIFVMMGQIAHATKRNESIATQLLATKERLANEIKHRLWAEKTTSESKIQSQFIDESFSVLLAYFTVAQRCRYHNRAYRNWFGLNANQIDGQFLQDFSGKEFYASLKNHMKDILAGKTSFNERTQKSAKGVTYTLTEQFIPHFDSKKKVIGFYTLYTPRVPEKNQISATTANQTSQPNEKTTSPELTAARIVKAIEGDEFRLYYQKILSLKKNKDVHDHYEILIRMAEEENNLMPPGTFLPLVEKFKMMPRLDRWVVCYMTKWLCAHQTAPGAKFCINIAKDTLGCTDFPAFVQDQLQKNNVPSNALCFEIEESDALVNPSATSAFAKKIRQLGCSVSLCGISHNQASVNLLKKINVDLIKIDGGLVYNIPHDEKDLSKVAAINRIAQTIKIQTVAELVETEDIMVKLREVGVDFAQGFGVARPRPLKELE
jgi:EAL domain-containing protein (putative c-di-GMP-specific phosphodiesterase class I)